jgi:hypothetical protein
MTDSDTLLNLTKSEWSYLPRRQDRSRPRLGAAGPIMLTGSARE